ncbi:unnamed protein product, partial [Polarella glacialis]
SLTASCVSLPTINGNGAADSTAEGSPSESSTAAPTSEKASFEMQRDHTLLMKQADVRRDVVMMLLFAISTGMSMYNGLKCISFHYDPKLLAAQGTLQASIIFFINLEYFMLKDFLKKLTEEKGELIAHLHMHPLFFDTGLKCHRCDVCSDATKGPHYIAYRCRTCDFDLCPRCYKQKDKQSSK